MDTISHSADVLDSSIGKALLSYWKLEIPAPDAPTRILLEVGGQWTTRRIGQKAPKNSTLAGVVSERNELLSSLLDGSRRLSAQEFLQGQEAVQYGRFPRDTANGLSTTISMWGVLLAPCMEVPKLHSLYQALSGRIPDPPAVVFANKEEYNPLELVVWTFEHLAEISDAQLRDFLCGSASQDCFWLRRFWLYMAGAHSALGAHHRVDALLRSTP